MEHNPIRHPLVLLAIRHLNYTWLYLCSPAEDSVGQTVIPTRATCTCIGVTYKNLQIQRLERVFARFDSSPLHLDQVDLRRCGGICGGLSLLGTPPKGIFPHPGKCPAMKPARTNTTFLTRSS